MVSQVPWNSYGAAVIGVSWMETGVTITLMSLRIYPCLGVVRSSVGADDTFMIFSGVSSIPATYTHIANSVQLLVVASAAANTVAVEYGFGYHDIKLTSPQFSRTIPREVVCESTMLIGMTTSKCSVALFLLRFSIKQWQRWVL